MKVINPATEQVVREYEEHGDAEVQEKLEGAERASEKWRETSLDQRAHVISSASKILRSRRMQYARTMTEEMGKPISQAESEVDKCAWVCEYYAEHAQQYLTSECVAIDGARSYVRFDPLGPVLAIMPWNFPFWQVFRFAAPALMAGNVGLLKHASNVPGSATAIEDVFQEAGLPAGGFLTLLIATEKVAELIRNPVVKAVTLTGSEHAGMEVAAEAGKQIKKTVLELGGSDPFIVLADADVSQVVGRAVESRTINSGQSCIAAKRFIVEDQLADAFASAMAKRMEHLRMGDPSERTTDVGPLARRDLRDSLHEQVTRSIELGAELLCGGEIPSGTGYYYPPTVLANVRPGMPAFDEETFGPVAAVTRAQDVDEAIQLANQSKYGLGASVWTSDIQSAERFAVELENGSVFVNEIVKSDPRVPFGGIKLSGFGRELSEYGIHEFTNIKTVWIQQMDVVQEASEQSFPASDAPSWTPMTST